jgi:GntR family transcriptional regulator
MFKRSPSLVEQVKGHLKQRIINAEFEDGRIPAEADLAQMMQVSRNTVRDALSRLEMEGIVIRRQGAGTFVNQASLMVKTRLEQITPYETLISDHGYTPTVRLLNATEIPAPPELAACLNLSPHQPVLQIKKLFLADNQPVIFSQTSFNPHLIVEPYTQDDLRGPVYGFMPHFCRQEFAYYLTEIVPVAAPPWLANSLQLPPHKTALISFEETGFNSDDQPIVKATSYFRDDLLRLRLIRRVP